MHIKVKLYKKTLKTVRIFVSSIFRNMHAERDHLMKVVFPELWERCAKRKLHLIDVDLQQGAIADYKRLISERKNIMNKENV